MEKRRNCSLGAISPLFHKIFYLLLDVQVQAGTRFSLRDKRLFEISEVMITSQLYMHAGICAGRECQDQPEQSNQGLHCPLTELLATTACINADQKAQMILCTCAG